MLAASPVKDDAPRVLSIPAGHPYVRHLKAPDGPSEVTWLPDPPTTGVPAGGWSPHRGLEPDWLARHRGEFDVVHLHFGFEHRSVAQIQEWLDALDALSVPLVYTVHDLQNPHLSDQGHHRAQLDLLIPAADAVITLTPGAGREIEHRWQREVHVAPHPHMVPLNRIAQCRTRTRRVGDASLRVGIPVGTARRNMALESALPVVARVMGRLPGSQLQIRADPRLRDPGSALHRQDLVVLLDALAQYAWVDVSWRARLDPTELWRELEELDVLLLPYRWGTHSGWVEECADLGTHVLVPAGVGYFIEQAPVLTYRADPTGAPDPDSLSRALREATIAPGPETSAQARREQRDRLARQHIGIYRRLIARA